MSAPRRVAVRLLSACDNACVVCGQEGAAPLAPRPLDDVRRELTAARPVAEEVTLTGGEPTGYDGLHAAVSFAREVGFFRVGIQSHARALAAPGAAESLAAAGLTDVHVSVHGGAAAHDYVTGVVGSHAETLAGVDAARAAGLTVVATTVLTRSNMRDLPAAAAALAARNVAVWCVSAPHAAGRALRDFDRVMPRLALAAPFALHALEAARKARLTGWIRGVPLCLLGPFAARSLEEAPRAYGAACDRCAARARCPGVDPAYLARFRGDELSARAEAPEGVSGASALARMFVGPGELSHGPAVTPRRSLPLAP